MLPHNVGNDVCFDTYSVLYWNNQPEQSGNQKELKTPRNEKLNSIIVRWHDSKTIPFPAT